jgi:hypothetical protein
VTTGKAILIVFLFLAPQSPVGAGASPDADVKPQPPPARTAAPHHSSPKVGEAAVRPTVEPTAERAPRNNPLFSLPLLDASELGLGCAD